MYRRNAVLCVLPTLLTAAAATTGCGGSARPEALRPSNYTLQHSDVGNAYKQDEAGRLSSRKAAIALSLPLSTLRGWGFVGGYERTFGLRDLSRAFGALNTVDSSVFATRTAAGAHSLFVWTIKGYGQQSPRLGIRPVGAESRCYRAYQGMSTGFLCVLRQGRLISVLECAGLARLGRLALDRSTLVHTIEALSATQAKRMASRH